MRAKLPCRGHACLVSGRQRQAACGATLQAAGRREFRHACRMVQLAQQYGRLPLARSLAPAITLARDGFPVDPRYARIAKLRERFLLDGVNTARTFLADNQAPQPGYLLRQPELALTLELIARHGRDGFTGGAWRRCWWRRRMRGGVWSLTDLGNYRAVERAPVRISYRGATIITLHCRREAA